MQIAVIGAGRWGSIHGRKLAQMPGVQIPLVVDPHRARGQALANALGARWCAEVPPALAACDAAVAAVPLGALAEVASAVLAQRTDLLVEKPAAMSAAAAEALVGLAAEQRCVLAVGYLERFVTPPLCAQRLQTLRVGPGARGTQLLFDWLVHDLDHAVRILGPGLEVERAQQTGARLVVELVGQGGRSARLEVGAAATRARWLEADGARLSLLGGDPLAAELLAFCAASADGQVDPRLALGADAVAVLHLAEAVQRQLHP